MKVRAFRQIMLNEIDWKIYLDVQFVIEVRLPIFDYLLIRAKTALRLQNHHLTN